MNPETCSAHELLHTLWTKAVGTEGYVKAEWKELEKRLKNEILSDMRRSPRTRSILDSMRPNDQRVRESGITIPASSEGDASEFDPERRSDPEPDTHGSN